MPSSIPAYTSVVPTPSSRDPSKATVDGAAIAGALVAAVIVALVVAVALVMIFLLRKRGKKSSATHPPVDNPIYSGTRKYYS